MYQRNWESALFLLPLFVHIWNSKNLRSSICKCWCPGTLWGSILESLLGLTWLLGYILQYFQSLSIASSQMNTLLLELRRSIPDWKLVIKYQKRKIFIEWLSILYHLYLTFETFNLRGGTASSKSLDIFCWFSTLKIFPH